MVLLDDFGTLTRSWTCNYALDVRLKIKKKGLPVLSSSRSMYDLRRKNTIYGAL